MPDGEIKGYVFNIQKFCLHDGPGIRATVFLKGCPLRCKWCANPESQSPDPILTTRGEKCRLCGACVRACPYGAITLDAKNGRRVDWDNCRQCFKCVDACIYGSLGISGSSVGVGELVREVEKDDAFYKRTGGGVTVSGGEPLFQFDFLLQLLRALKMKGFHTTLDTCGHAPGRFYDQLLQYVDLVLYDIKHLDSGMHREYTGVDNTIILGNAERVAKRVKTWFRIPLISGFNDSPGHIGEIAAIAKKLGIEKISFLPYHEGGQLKSFQIGKVYEMPYATAPDRDHIGLLAGIAVETGVNATVDY